MPIEIHWEEPGVLLEVSGLLSGQDLLESNQAIYSSGFDIDYQNLDLSNCEGIAIDAEELHAVLRQDVAAKGRADNHRMAYVAPARLIQAIAPSVRAFRGWVGLRAQMASFETLEEARAWATEPPASSED